jgi:hypothetical protein
VWIDSVSDADVGRLRQRKGTSRTPREKKVAQGFPSERAGAQDVSIGVCEDTEGARADLRRINPSETDAQSVVGESCEEKPAQ